MEFTRVPLPHCPVGGPTTLSDNIHRWITSAPLRALVEAFGGRLPSASTADTLTWVADFSAQHWDFRAGVERHNVREVRFSDELARLVSDAADALGLRTPQLPQESRYDHLLVLGGLARACIQRTSFGAWLLKERRLDVGELAALGSFRPLGQDESGLLETLGADHCRYEVDAMDAGIQRAFGFAGSADVRASVGAVTHESWAIRRYRAPGLPAISALAAPSTEPAARRANTADTYRFWADQVRVNKADRVLVVTSPIYVPFQHADAFRSIGLTHGCGIETIGFDDSVVEPRLRLSPTTDRYLQEVRSGILSMRRLYLAC